MFTNVSGNHDEGYKSAIDSAGRIVVAGHTQTSTGWDFAVTRYLPNGQLDPTFGNGGIATADFGSGDAYGYGMTLDSQGRILVVGRYGTGSDPGFAIARFDQNGALDPTFGTDGKVVTQVGPDSDEAWAVTVDSLGRIVVAGQTYNPGTSWWDVLVARYNDDGSLDTTFGNGGTVVTPVGPVSDAVRSVAVDSSNNIVVAGFAQSPSYYDFLLIRYKPDGTLDTDFDGDGIVTTGFGSAHDEANAMTIDSSGRIVVAIVDPEIETAS